jgi:hypothetical protein
VLADSKGDGAFIRHWAFFEGDGQFVETDAFEGASPAFTAAGLKARGRGTLYSIDPHPGEPPLHWFRAMAIHVRNVFQKLCDI